MTRPDQEATNANAKSNADELGPTIAPTVPSRGGRLSGAVKVSATP